MLTSVIKLLSPNRNVITVGVSLTITFITIVGGAVLIRRIVVAATV